MSITLVPFETVTLIDCPSACGRTKVRPYVRMYPIIIHRNQTTGDKFGPRDSAPPIVDALPMRPHINEQT